jgi:glutamine phosphoribosylpyrophosphate amidotransferase
MVQAVRRQNPAIRAFCTACFSGAYPTRDVSRGYLEQIEQEREQQKLKQKDLALTF